MMEDYWLKQAPDKPLFDDILWARPETKRGAGKLLIVGGNAHGFAAAQEAFVAADKTGAGHIRLVLPDALKRTVGILGPYDYAPSTVSGSFGRDALNELLLATNWADHVLLAGDLGRNSETAILLENFVQKYGGPLTVTKDTVDYFYNLPQFITERPETVIVLELAQLQKLGMALKFETPFLMGMGTLLLVQALHTFTLEHPAMIVTEESGNVIVAYQGKVSSTKAVDSSEDWRVSVAAAGSVFYMQHPSKLFEAVTSSLVYQP